MQNNKTLAPFSVFSPLFTFLMSVLLTFLLTALSHTLTFLLTYFLSPLLPISISSLPLCSLSVYVHKTDDVGWLSSSHSWVCIYLRLLGRECQHHPEQMSLEIHFGRTRNKKFFFFLFISPSPVVIYTSYFVPVSAVTRLPFLVLANESARSQRYTFFHSVHLCACQWQWWLFVFPSFVIANKFEMEKER